MEFSAKEKLDLLRKELLSKAKGQNILYPLSYGQKALWFLYQNAPESSSYSVAFTARIVSEYDTAALKRAFQRLINRHPSLRTTFIIQDGKPLQKVNFYEEVFFEVIDSSSWNETNLKAKVKETYSIPFKLEAGPLFRVHLFQVSGNNCVLLINMHHIINDSWSIGIMLNELKLSYTSELEGSQTSFSQLKYEYSDFVSAQEELVKSEKGEHLWEYWKEELSGELPVLNLPADKPRPPIQSYNGAVEYFTLEKDLIERLKKLSQNEGTTLFVTLLTAYQILLHIYSGQEEIMVGTPVLGRNQIEYDKVVGYFINPVAIRGNFLDNPVFKVLLNRIRTKVLNAISNQDIPFQLIVERVLHTRDASRSPVFQTFFGFQKVQQNDDIQELIVPGNKNARVNFGKLILEFYEISQQEGQFDLTAEFVEGKNLFSGAFKYNTDLFDELTIKQMIVHFKNLLTGIVSNPVKKISELSLLSEEELFNIVHKWNDTDFSFKEIDCMHKLIEQQTELTPDAIAVICEEEEISFENLNKRANQLARYLRNFGAGREILVGICVERSIDLVVGILGILKAGAAYIPIDPFYPKSRIDLMIDDSKANILITQKSLVDNLPTSISTLVLIDADWKDIAKEEDSNFDSGVELSNLAYVIYTSGSTGIPKGVMITHSSLSNHMLWMKPEFRFDSSDIVLQKTPFSFDASVWEFFLPLFIGGRLIMAKPDGHLDPSYLIKTIIKNNVTIFQAVPSLLKLMLDEKGIEECKSLKAVFSGGEALTKDLQKKLFEKLSVDFYNLYGPTEATIDATYFNCNEVTEIENIPIGKPIYNTQAYILNKYLNPVPVGVHGELYIGGADVARGYLNNPELTKQRFIDDIFRNSPGAKLYKTGDLTKYFHDGDIQFLGRVDHQVKLRGFRIELEEIESKLLQHEKIKETVVIVREDKLHYMKLIAYVVPIFGYAPTINDMKQYLREVLPEYMVPSMFMFLDNLPLTSNGKVDRNALPTPEIKTHAEDYVPPKLPVEKLLTNIWKEILGIQEIGIHDNFFELGGDSIISIQIISKANQSGLKITPKQIFQYQTIAELASVIEHVTLAKTNQEIVTGDVPLSPVQQWFFEQELPEPQHYNHSVLLKVPSKMNTQYLKESVSALIQHHDALRLTFEKENFSWKQFNSDVNYETPFEAIDLHGLSYEEQVQEMRKNIDELQRGFNLTKGPLINVRLFKLGNNVADRLLIIIHHLSVDGISWRIILEDLYNCYNQLSNNETVKLPFKTTSFKDWSNLLRDYGSSEKLLEEKNYWVSISEENCNLFPTDISQGKFNNIIESVNTTTISLDEQATESLLQDVPKAYNTKINDILLTSLIIAYYNLTYDYKMLINLEGHGRVELFDSVDLSRTVGWFTSIFPVVLKLENPDDLGESIKSIKEYLRKIPNQGIGYGLLRYGCDDKTIKEKLALSQEPQIIFNYLGQMNENVSNSHPENLNSYWKFGRTALILDQNKKGNRRYLIDINSMITGGRLVMDFNYSQNIHSKEVIEKFANLYKDALHNIITHCTSPESGGFTPSDFSSSGLNQQELDNLLANLK